MKSDPLEQVSTQYRFLSSQEIETGRLLPCSIAHRWQRMEVFIAKKQHIIFETFIHWVTESYKYTWTRLFKHYHVRKLIFQLYSRKMHFAVQLTFCQRYHHLINYWFCFNRSGAGWWILECALCVRLSLCGNVDFLHWIFFFQHVICLLFQQWDAYLMTQCICCSNL